MYGWLRSLLFLLEAEKAHALALHALRYMPQRSLSCLATDRVEAMGLSFPHAIGLAAGFDKNGAFLNGLAKLGFAFIEVGTVTPRPQKGNPRPRLFRLPKAHALINRMGFNNDGVEALIGNLQRTTYQGLLGINIGKNKETPLQRAVEDYLYCLNQVYPYASYITINISSPNTPELRQLQQMDFFQALVKSLCKARQQLIDRTQRYVPLVFKVSPDESDETLKNMAQMMLLEGIEGVIASNTTCDRSQVQRLTYGQEEGGLSGRPLFERANHCLGVLKAEIGDGMTLFGVGGIENSQDARKKCELGASLLQVYTGLVYQGPGLVETLLKGLR